MRGDKKKLRADRQCVIEPVQDAFGIVIFGASGDLTKKKLLPSLFNLYENGLLPKSFYILGASRTEMSDQAFRQSVSDSFSDAPSPRINRFLAHLHYQPIRYTDLKTFAELKKRLQSLDKRTSAGNRRLFYLAVPPALYEDILTAVGDSRLASRRGWNRIVVERPFGWDLRSAKHLNHTLNRYFDEADIFRIDHYLGKETVQDILLFRFANSMFEPLWNRNHIDHIQITAAETIGIGERGGYYDKIGIIRDMFQNHIVQLLSLVAMEPPPSFEPKRIREEKVKVFRSLRPISRRGIPENVVLGQYMGGEVDGTKVPGYREEQGISPDSPTPTFAALKVCIDNWRWQGVPFYLRSGKRLKRRITEVSVHFKNVPHSIFAHILSGDIKRNVLSFKIQPDEAIELIFQTKIPGARLCLRDVTMNFSYKDYSPLPIPEAYERVLLDCLHGDHLLFVGQDGVELAWEFFMPILRSIEDGKKHIPVVREYPSGTWGPPDSEELIRRDSRQWWQE